MKRPLLVLFFVASPACSWVIGDVPDNPYLGGSDGGADASSNGSADAASSSSSTGGSGATGTAGSSGAGVGGAGVGVGSGVGGSAGSAGGGAASGVGGSVGNGGSAGRAGATGVGGAAGVGGAGGRAGSSGAAGGAGGTAGTAGSGAGGGTGGKSGSAGAGGSAGKSGAGGNGGATAGSGGTEIVDASSDANPCDVDRDGYLSIPCGGNDCDDDAVLVHPNQANYFEDPTHPGGTTFDYDCNHTPDPLFTTPVNCAALPLGLGCSGADSSFLGTTAPACGQVGRFGHCQSGLLSCTEVPEQLEKKMPCR